MKTRTLTTQAFVAHVSRFAAAACSVCGGAAWSVRAVQDLGIPAPGQPSVLLVITSCNKCGLVRQFDAARVEDKSIVLPDDATVKRAFANGGKE